MKFKFLSILMAAVVAVTFTSCGDKSNTSESTSNENNENKTEKVAETDGSSAAAIEKDAKDFVDKAYALFKNVKSAEDFQNAHNEADRLFEERLDYYKKKNNEDPIIFEKLVEKEMKKGLKYLERELKDKYIGENMSK